MICNFCDFIKKYIKKLASYIIIILFVATVFAVVTYAQDVGSNSTVSNFTLDNKPASDFIIPNLDNDSTVDNASSVNNTNASVETDFIIPNLGASSNSDNETNVSIANDTNVSTANETTAADEGVQITALHPWERNSQEYLDITNYACYPVDLEGFQLQEKHCGTNYTFPSVVIQPGATMQVFTKAGQDSENVFHMSFKEHIFSEHDTAKLVYESDFTTVVDENDKNTTAPDTNNATTDDNLTTVTVNDNIT